jgi:hypothetical protein
VKLTPSNQSLILAGEPPLGRPSRLVASGSASKRATIPAARPDAVVVQAESLSRDDTPSVDYRNPIQLYTRTQRGLEDTPKAALVDVFA